MRNALVSYRERKSRSPSRSNVNDTDNPNKSSNLDAEWSARMADRHLPAAVHLRRV
jgi:hypothetical protein